MIGYVTLGTNDLDSAAEFYDAIAKEMGGSRMMEEEGYFIAWTGPDNTPGFAATRPFDKKKATVGNGMMVALQAKDPEQVDRIHALALELGGSDEGAPGQRGGGFYAGYFRDRDGNKLNAFCMTSVPA
ncbi:VOC family protein [Aurantiacibacter sediminis]|uniref:VOC family protein n=1 Tax=Aurantiacibacter sediminis TaxID=2793064 RepID=A0ABS0MZP9_9SPHN|nr:VOC family protein [Aurantiacibacter sediminis]MBH5321188.1 VOC family protein [Aurantiacibacter sediminis]